MANFILVLLSGKPEDEQALPVGVAIARHAGLRVRLLHVQGHTYEPDRSDARAGEAYVRSRAELIEGRAGVDTDHVRLEGNPLSEVPAYIEEHQPALVVLAAQPKGLLDRFFQGSVAEKVIRQETPPVLLIRPHQRAVERERAEPYRNVLVPLDGSRESEAILDQFATIRLLDDAVCTLLYVNARAGVGTPENLDDPAVYLERAHSRLPEQVRRVKTLVVEHSSAVNGIMAFSGRDDVDLIAMTTHGWGGLRNVLLGSTTAEIVRNATTDLLLYRPREP